LRQRVQSGAIYALMAVGIGLVFGVLRLVNFGVTANFVMAGAFALALAYEWGVAGLGGDPALFSQS